VNYCGIDVASKSSYVYVMDESGKKLSNGEVATTKEGLVRRLRPYLAGGLAVAIEAGNQTAWIHDWLMEIGAQVTVVNPTKVKLIAESRKKTDKIDAKILCELLRLNALPHPVHMPGKDIRALRGLLVARRQLVSARAKLCHVVRGLLRQDGVRLPPREIASFVGWQRVLAAGFAQPQMALIVAAYYESFVTLTRSIRALERDLAEFERREPRVARLRTMPKVGPIAALTFVAAVDDVRRFPNSRKLVGYTGLAPSVRSSGERTEYGRITREGRAELRAVWVEIAHLVAADTGRATAPLRKWFAQLAYRRGKKTAIVALARRLLVIAYHLLRDETVYDPARLKRVA